jgi:hypothetical protein
MTISLLVLRAAVRFYAAPSGGAMKGFVESLATLRPREHRIIIPSDVIVGILIPRKIEAASPGFRNLVHTAAASSVTT